MDTILVDIGNNITVGNPPTDMLNWAKKTLTLANPEYAKKTRMGFWIGDTPKAVSLYEMHGDKLILPFGTLADIAPWLLDARVTNRMPSVRPVNYCGTVPLYDYQREAVDAVKERGYGILQSPAGSGKTQMGIALMCETGVRTLWLTHTLDLLYQSKRRAEQYIDPALIGTITGGKVNIGRGVTFATVQTMSMLDLTALRDEWDMVIVDECHRCAGSPASVTRFYKVLNNLAARHKYGLSATVHRADGLIQSTYALLGKVVYSVPETSVAERVMTVKIHPIETKVQLGWESLNPDGTLNYTKMLTALCENRERSRLIATIISLNGTHSSLILSDRLGHLEEMMSLLSPTLRQKAVMISGKMTSKQGKADREKALEQMRNGEKLFLFATYSLAKEGLDIPCLDRLYLTTPQKDYAVITQSIGRIARTSPGKRQPVCYDFIDDSPYLMRAYKERCRTYRKNGCEWEEEK